MASYDFLNGVTVVEVASLGPSSLGGYLADMGATVIKVEDEVGDPVRYNGTPAVGGTHGVGLLHLRWNRGKQSVGLNLKSPAGAELFRRLVDAADVVIEGMRAGVLDRLGFGFESIRQRNAAVVFCSVSGFGRSGPYHALGSHGPSYDAFAGLSSANPYAMTAEERASSPVTAIGMHLMGVHSAIGVLAALYRARATGQGALIEVAASDSAAHWIPDGVDRVLNAPSLYEREGFNNNHGRQAGWARMYRYDTADGRGVFFQAYGRKFWDRFCVALGREDLRHRYDDADDVGQTDVDVHRELALVFAGRSLEDWMAFFRANDVPGSPANTVSDLAVDAHFLARDNVYDVTNHDGTVLHLTTTPVKTPGQSFEPALAPRHGEHTYLILHDHLGVPAEEIERLRSEGVVYLDEVAR